MKYLCVHETNVTRTNTPQLNAVNRYHKEKWNMISSLGWYVAYNEFVDIDGKRTKTRKFGEETMAQKGFNCDVLKRCTTYSVCFALNGSTQTFNEAQTRSWKEIVAEYPKSEITLHRNLQPNRTCPGKLITVDYLKGLLLPKEDQDKKQIENLIKYRDILMGILRLLRK